MAKLLHSSKVGISRLTIAQPSIHRFLSFLDRASEAVLSGRILIPPFAAAVNRHTASYARGLFPKPSFDFQFKHALNDTANMAENPCRKNHGWIIRSSDRCFHRFLLSFDLAFLSWPHSQKTRA